MTSRTARLLVGILVLALVVSVVPLDVFAKKPPKPPPEPPGPPPGADPAICYRPANGTQVWAMDDDGSNQYQVSTVSHFYANWSPDGKHIVFDRGPGALWRVDVNGDNEYFLVDGSEPAWSPSGDVIAYAGNDWTTLGLIPAGGGTSTTLFTASGDNWITTPTWNAAGTHIAFHENDDRGVGPVYVMEIATGDIETIATLHTWHIRWARTQDLLVYQNDSVGGIYTFDMDTDASTFVTDGKRPCWSPDDTQLVIGGSVEVQGKGKKRKTRSGLIKYTIATGEKTFLVAGSFGDWKR